AMALRPDVGQASDKSGNDLAIDREVPGLQVHVPIVGGEQVWRTELWERSVLGNVCVRGREGVHDARIRIVEALLQSSERRQHCAVRSLVRLIIHHDRVLVVVEDAISAANGGLAVAEYVICKAEPWTESRVNRGHAARRHSVIAREYDSRWGVDETR